MAKSKLKTEEEANIPTVNVKQTFIHIKKKYKPIPKFNGECPNC